MKLLVALSLVALVAAAPQRQQYQQQYQYQSDPNQIQLLRFDSDIDGTGNYRYAYEESNGQTAEEQGEVVRPGQEDESIAVKGSYSWVGPDGVTYKVNYIADDNGFQPTIEQGPGGGVPPAVVASLLG